MPTLACNFNCPYCVTETANNQLFEVSQDDRKTIQVDAWESWWSKIGSLSSRVDTYTSGGEPLAYPGIEKYLLSVDKLTGFHWLATNLSFPCPVLETGGVKQFTVAASAHLTQPKFDADLFLKRARSIADHLPLSIKVIEGHASEERLFMLQARARRLGLKVQVVADRSDQKRLPVKAASDSQ